MSDKKSIKFKELRARAEQLLYNAGGKQHHSSSTPQSLNLDELVHELEVHQMELEMQHTELQESNRRLEHSRREYVDLFDFAPVGYIIMDSKGYILRVNLTLAAMFGLNRTDIEGQSFAKFVHADYKDIYYLHRQHVFETQEAQSCEIIVNLPAESFHARLDSDLIADSSQYRVALSNIDKQKQAEQAIQTALNRERELSHLKGHLLEMITHEFRTPLSIILSSIGILEKYADGLSEEKKVKRYQNIRDYVGHLSRMVSEIATAYRNEMDTLSVKLEEFDCAENLNDLVFGMEAINSGRISITIENVTNEDYNINFDKTLLRQIVINLLNNALKYSKDTVTLSLSMTEDDFTINVGDKGHGIPPEDHDKIYDTFFRSQNVSNLSSGTGIGLSIVKRLVDTCKGNIDFTSTPGEGTTFIITFPRNLQETG